MHCWIVTESFPYYRQTESESHQLKNLYILRKIHNMTFMALSVKRNKLYSFINKWKMFSSNEVGGFFGHSLLHTVSYILIVDKLKWYIFKPQDREFHAALKKNLLLKNVYVCCLLTAYMYTFLVCIIVDFFLSINQNQIIFHEVQLLIYSTIFTIPDNTI